jgi:hypothetical protein
MQDLWSEDELVVFETLRELAGVWDSDPQSMKDRAAIHGACGDLAIVSANEQVVHLPRNYD